MFSSSAYSREMLDLWISQSSHLETFDIVMEMAMTLPLFVGILPPLWRLDLSFSPLHQINEPINIVLLEERGFPRLKVFRCGINPVYCKTIQYSTFPSQR